MREKVSAGRPKTGTGRIREWCEDALVSTRFLRSLPGYLRRPFSEAEAREIIRRRLELREEKFLNFVHARVFEIKSNPYFRLMGEAGIEFGDLALLVQREGIEGALRQLLASGVYLTVDEFKGRRLIRRGSLEFSFDSAQLIHQKANVHGVAQSSGSAGPRTAVPIDLASIYDHAINTLVTLSAHLSTPPSHAHWGRPGGTAVTNQVEFALSGNAPRKWFSPVPLSGPGIHPRYRWGSMAMRWAGRLVGEPFPLPEICTLADPTPLIEWARKEISGGRTPHIWTFSSSAVCAANSARERGIDLKGAIFTGGGEPTTEARRQAVESVGAQLLPRYGTTETDIISFACANPATADDQHFLHDRLALIQAGRHCHELGIPESGLMVTTLLASSPLTLINVSLGDTARLEKRSCGCPLESIGWKTHLSRITSFEKLTAGGTTFFDTDLVEILEVSLPKVFGGCPTDYQIVETQSEKGEAMVLLLVHPRVSGIDSDEIGEYFHRTLGDSRGGEKLMELFWRSSGFLRIERREPYRTASGKVPHVHHLSEDW